MKNLNRIVSDPDVMGGKPCIKGLRMTVSTVIGLLASGITFDGVLATYPYLHKDDILQALSYAAYRLQE